jgi:hypothetical protein
MSSRTTNAFYRIVRDAVEAEEMNGNVETIVPITRPRAEIGTWELRAHLERRTRPLPPRDIFSYAAQCVKP